MNAAAKLSSTLKRLLKPLGEGAGRGHTKKVSRWKTKTGIPIVSENQHPNVWITQAFYSRQKPPDESKILVEEKAPTARDRGFHSNVMETPGMAGTVVKLSPANEDCASYFVEYLERELGA
jgi:hypothetical protein